MILSKTLQASVDEGLLSEADAIGLAAAHIQRGAGRPPRDGGTVPTTLRLTVREREALATLGDGDMTAGIRAALEALPRA